MRKKKKPVEKADGKLVWAVRDASEFSTPLAARMWNGRYAGKPLTWRTAGEQLRAANGDGKRFYPINRDLTDTSLDNLGLLPNRRRSTNNKSGTPGVSWDKRRNKWHAYISVGKRLHLGYFENKQDAIAARRRAERKHNFPEGYGE